MVGMLIPVVGCGGPGSDDDPLGIINSETTIYVNNDSSYTITTFYFSTYDNTSGSDRIGTLADGSYVNIGDYPCDDTYYWSAWNNSYLIDSGSIWVSCLYDSDDVYVY